MAILKVARMGHPVLRQKASVVTKKELQSQEVQNLVKDMIDTMDDYQGVGLAAPQVHISKRIFVFQMGGIEAEEGKEGKTEVEILTLINPEIWLVSETKALGMEGCLSIPGIRGIVPRWERIGVKALGSNGEVISFEAQSYPARVIQHELDHLDGILFLDRMDDLRSLSFLEEYLRYDPESIINIESSEN